MAPYIMDAWYMVAWSNEISSEMLSRELLGQAVLLTRGSDGSAIVMRDRCPHRFAPLSRGRRKDGRFICGYHGLEFDETGRCVHNPYAERIPASATVVRYPTVESDGIVWAWFGDAKKSDPALVPDFSPTSCGPQGAKVDGHSYMHANYEYGSDNLLDLSHIEFVHTGTFAGNGVIFQGKHKVDQVGKQLHSNWWMPNISCPDGLFKAVLQSENVDHWLDVRWDAPSNMYLQIGAARPDQPRETGIAIHQSHLLTPANEHETHYFWSATVDFPQRPEETAMFRDMLREAFDLEDKPMIEAAYRNVANDFWEEKPISLGVDAAGVLARRIVQSMKVAEAKQRQG